MDWKKIGKKLLFPPVWLMVILVILSAVALGALAMILGIIIGVLGMVLVALAYPTYNRVLQKYRRKIAPEVLRLSEELLR